MALILRRTDEPAADITICQESNILGRGSLLQCLDKKVSRNHAELTFNNDLQAVLISKHVNPCFIHKNGQKHVLQQGNCKTLKSGSIFSLLPDKYCFEVIIKSESREKQSEDVASSSNEFDKKKRILPSWMSNANSPKKVKTVKTLNTSTKKSHVKRKKNNHSCSDSDENDTKIPEKVVQNCVQNIDSNQSSSQNVAKKRDSCQYGEKCYQKSSKHVEEYSHPGDSDYSLDKNSPEKRKVELTSTSMNSSDSDEETSIGNVKVQKNGDDDLSENDSFIDDDDLSEKDTFISDDSTSDEELANSNSSIKRKKKYHPSTDSDENDTKIPEKVVKNIDSNQSTSQNVVKKRDSCQYGEKCYQKSSKHVEEYSHPGDSDYSLDDDSDDENDGKPDCEYGIDCYRKNKKHRQMYNHTNKVRPKRKAAKKKMVQPASYDDDDDDDDDASDLTDDESDLYDPSKDE